MVKPGYKQTEIGVLPESWDTITFEECFAILPNNTLSRAELNYNGGEVRNIHYGDILVKFPAVLDCSAEGLPYINKGNVAKASKGFLRDGDLIMADTAEDVIVGKSTEVIGIGDSKIVSGLHTIPCRPRDAEMFAPKWLGYFINHCTYHDQLIPYITGIKVSSVSKSAISSTVIAVPPKPEQEAIAEALTDIDALIVNLEKLIAKKKAIKQGAMQELLTGKRRLPGFGSEWKLLYFRETGIQILKGQTITQKNVNIGNIPVVAGGKTPAYYCDKANRFGRNITISASGASAGFVNFYSGDIFASDCSTIGESEKYSVEYIYYILLNMQTAIYAAQTGGAQPHIHPKDIYELTLLYTFDVEEQSAIARVLSDMDNEIIALEQKLDKANQIKKGMMSELLTGRIRLIDKEDA